MQELEAGWLFHPLLLDPGALATTGAQEIQLGTADLTNFMDNYRLNVWGGDRECSFHAYAVRHFTYRESGRETLSLSLDDIPFEALDALFVSLDNLVIDGHIVTCLKRRKCAFRAKLFVYVCDRGIHDSFI